MTTRGIFRGLAVAGAFLTAVLIGCQQQEGGTARETAQSTVPEITNAICVLHPTEGNSVTGTVTFTAVSEGVRVVADIQGLSPGSHGFHVHDFGDCSAPDATSAGGHYAPRGMPHAAPTDAARHVGDLGNVVADSTGVAHLDWVDPLLRLNGEHSVIGRAVIVHANRDDLATQPTGAAGPRLACGVIGIDGKN
jgi:Cu-Zn family superoxide dismutase